MPTIHDKNHNHVVDAMERFDWQFSTNGLTADEPAAPDCTLQLQLITITSKFCKVPPTARNKEKLGLNKSKK